MLSQEDYSGTRPTNCFQKTNVQVAEVIGNDMIKVRVWEREWSHFGIWIICLCCGDAAFRRGYTGNRNKIIMEGDLDISLQEDGVWMTGKTVRVYDETIPESFFSQPDKEHSQKGNNFVTFGCKCNLYETEGIKIFMIA